MKRKTLVFLCLLLAGLCAGGACSALNGSGNNKPAAGSNQTNRQPNTNGQGQYSIDQAISDKAQLNTIAFSGLAFITGSAGADTFFPPGKVADFFGFQYMRDVDTAGYGHNTTFLTKAANNVLYILNDEQKAKLTALAQEQEQVYKDFAYNRFGLMQAFRQELEGKLPAGSSGLSQSAVKEYTAHLYLQDAQLSYRRAEVVGEIISSFTPDQKAYFDKMAFNNSATWPDIKEEPVAKQSLSPTAHVAVMTYASELFSWYKGSQEADVYFCPERHGTYFGGFYMKDYPAMGNPNYFISTSQTGNQGEAFLNVLNSDQRKLITEILDLQRADLQEIVSIRQQVSAELRKGMQGQTIDKEKAIVLIKRYGELDGEMSGLYAERFSQVNKTLTAEQRAALVKLRNLNVVPQGAYYFSTPIKMPSVPSTDFLFGIGSIPADAGHYSAPAGFTDSTEKKNDKKPGPPKP